MNYAYSGQSVPMQSVRPTWIEDLSTFYEGRIARQFVLHFNITDFVIDTNERIESGKGEYERRGDVVNVADQPVTMREYLHSFLFQALQCQAVYTYSLAGGLIADDRSAFLSNSNESGQALIRGQTNSTRKNIALQLLYDASKTLEINPRTRKQTGQPEEGQEIELPDDIAENFKLLGHLLRQPHYATGSGGPAQGNNHAETPVAVILDYAEKMIPYQLGDGHGDREQLQALEVVQRWALDPLIRKTKNLVLLLTNNIANIPTDVYAEGSGCKAIRVPLPSEGERAAYIRFAMTRGRPRFVPLDPGNFQQPEQALRLARVTQGMRLRDIDNVSRRVIVEARKRQRSQPDLEEKPPIMKLEDVQRAKAEVIEAQSAQLLEIVPPVRGFNEIGGLEKLKIYLRKRTVLMRSGKYLPLVPSGLLLAGPPGTGKTIIAEALATESGFNLVKMRNIQDKWVGSSERNLELVMNLLKDLYPVVVFIDEIDQAMVRRDTGQSGDSGVGARMFARILEEMSNASNRGRILWVAATNRADIIDAALLRRFDRVVPLLVPDVRESCRIFATILSTIMKQSTDNMQVAYGESLQQSGRKDVLGRPDPTQDDLEKFLPVAHVTAEKGLTGAAIEIIVRRAIEIAYEEKYDEGAKDNIQSLASGLPLIELRHLQMALHDFKPNYNRLTYDHQSLLALRACNFYSIIPSLPKTDLYESIQTTEGLIDSDKLDIAIGQIEAHLRSISMNS